MRKSSTSLRPWSPPETPPVCVARKIPESCRSPWNGLTGLGRISFPANPLIRSSPHPGGFQIHSFPFTAVISSGHAGQILELAAVGDFHDPTADHALFDSIRSHARIDAIELDEEINSPVFARTCSEKLLSFLNERGTRATGGNEFPSEAQLRQTDFLILHAEEADEITGADRGHL